MTLGELLDAARSHTRPAFADTPWTVHDQTPDATGLPAVWLELTRGNRNRGNGGAMSTAVVRIIAAVENLENGPTVDELVDAADRLIARWRTSPPPVGPSTWSWALGVVEVGGVDHTGLMFDLTIDYPTPC